MKELKVKEIPVWSRKARYWRKNSGSEGHRRRFQKNPVCIGFEGFPCGATGKESTCQLRLDIRDMGSIPESERFPGGGYSNSLQYSCLEQRQEEPGRLPFMGSQRVGHNWSNLAQTCRFQGWKRSYVCIDQAYPGCKVLSLVARDNSEKWGHMFFVYINLQKRLYGGRGHIEVLVNGREKTNQKGNPCLTKWWREAELM